VGRDVKVGVSILAADFSRLASEIKKCEDAGVDCIHLDVMDGHFVKNITIGPVIARALRPLTKIPLDAHLMIENPDMYVEDFVTAGVDMITVHAECYGERKPSSRGRDAFPKEVESIDVAKAKKDLQRIRTLGAKTAMAINPGTPLCIQDVLEDLDMVLIMSVNPGFAGQSFMSSVVPKIQELRKAYTGDIEVDGGINQETAGIVVAAGANVLATASYFFTSEKPQETVRKLKQIRV
jgi:ribulose-phosphate 3-epimerase